MKKGSGRIVNQSQLADLLGVQVNTIVAWRKEGMPCLSLAGKKGVASQFDVAEVFQWLQARAARTGSDEIIDRRAEENRLAKSKADLSELELAQRQGMLLEAPAVEETWARILANFRAKLLGLPSKLAPELADMNDPREVQGYLRKAMNEMLDELSETDVESLCGSIEDDDPLGT